MMDRAVCVFLVLLLAACGTAQQVAECTVQDGQQLAGELSAAILQDVADGRTDPSDYLQGAAAALARDHGVRLVRCALRALIEKWSGSRRSAAPAGAVELARKLDASL